MSLGIREGEFAYHHSVLLLGNFEIVGERGKNLREPPSGNGHLLKARERLSLSIKIIDVSLEIGNRHTTPHTLNQGLLQGLQVSRFPLFFSEETFRLVELAGKKAAQKGDDKEGGYVERQAHDEGLEAGEPAPKQAVMTPHEKNPIEKCG